MVNKIFELVDDLKNNILLFRDNISHRKAIIKGINIEVDNEKFPLNQSVVCASPAVPHKSKPKKKLLLKSTKRSASKNANTNESIDEKDKSK